MTESTVPTQRSACPLDCPDGCSLDVITDGERVIELKGSRVNPLTGGFICSKVKRYPDHVHGAERLLSPAVRIGAKGAGEFRDVGWDEALDLIAARFTAIRRERGGEAVLPLAYGGSNGSLTDGAVDERFFRRLGASRLARTVCAAPTGAAARGLYGGITGTAIDDVVHARMILLWGVNPSVSGIHLVPAIRRAQKAGATLAVVDPRRTPLAESADVHLPLRPGTDLPVALSLLRGLFEGGAADDAFLAEHATGAEELRRRAKPWTFARAAETAGVAAADIEKLLELYRAGDPALLRCGWGLERNRNGGSAVASVLGLPAVAGKFGVRGGGFMLSNGGAWQLDHEAAIGTPPTATREINMNRVGHELLSGDPGIAGLFVYNANPLMTLPRQDLVRRGLERDDLFTVVFEQVLTDSCRYADVLLPATTFLEHTELRRGYGTMALQRSDPVIPAVGLARPNYEVFHDLCERCGLAEPEDESSPDGLTEALIASHPHADRIRDELRRHGITYPYAEDPPVQFVDSLPRTADGKIHLVPEQLDAEAPGGLYHYRELEGDARFPLTLLSPATHRTVSSTLGQLWRERAPVELTPRDAESRRLEDGAAVRVFNDFGEVRTTVKVTEELREGVALLPKGLWSHHTADGNTANTLAPDSLTDVAGGACFNDARVEVEPI